MLQNKTNKTSDETEVSHYLPGFHQKNIPWWPFIIMGILMAGAVGVATATDIGIPSSLIVVGVFGMFILILILQKPELGSFILIISVFTSFSDILTDRGFPGINRPLIALTIGSVLINFFLKTGRYNQFPTLTKSEWALIIFYITLIVSVIVASDKSSAFDTIIDITKDILVGISIYITLNTSERWKTGVNTLFITVTILAAMGVYKTATGSDVTFFDMARNSLFGQVGSADELRYGGPIGEPNLWGQILVSTTPFLMYQIKKKQSTQSRITLIVCLLLILLAMIYTSSRGAIVALAVIMPFVVIDMKIKPATVLIGIILFIGLLSVLPDTYAKRFGSLNVFSNNELSQDEAVSGREAAMLTGLAMFEANPIFGVGFGNYGNHYWEYVQKIGLESAASNINLGEESRFAHSLYIEILSETGSIGFLSFSFFFAVLFSSLLSIRKKFQVLIIHDEWTNSVTALIMSIFTFLVSGFFLHGIFFRYIWVLIGLALAAISISENTKPILLRSQKGRND